VKIRKKVCTNRGIHRKQGFFIVDHEPTLDERREHALIAKVKNDGGYRASRTRIDLPASKALVRVIQDATIGENSRRSDAWRQRADVHLRRPRLALDRRPYRQL